MHILISNDDGIHARGIRVLSEALLRDGNKVTVAAPDRERSASGHALTMRDPLYAERVGDYPAGIDAWSVTGTPVDCTRIGLTALADAPVDLVISGINHGPNVGSDTIYSGTVAAAMEAVLLGCPAMAVSTGAHDISHLDTAALWTCRIARWLASRGLDKNCVINVNVPSLPLDEIKGIRKARLARRNYDSSYTRMVSPYGREHYWLASWVDQEQKDEGSDWALVDEGYVTVTPLSWSLMDERAFDQIEIPEGGI